jgi:hypothetical protein
MWCSTSPWSPGTIQDLGSTNGTAVGVRENLVISTLVTASDTVFFGSRAVPVARLLTAVPDASPAPERRR